MRINSLMNNPINNVYQNNNQNTPFKGIEKAVAETASTVGEKAKKKDGFIVKALNKYFHLDEHIARATAALSQTKTSQNLVEWTRKKAHGAARWCDIESIAVTFFYMWNTWKSDKVDEERKVPSMIQNGAVTIASSAAAALVDGALDPIIDNIGLKYIELEKTNPGLIKEIGGRSAKDFYDAIKKLKSNTVFTAVVRFIIPVMMVPVVGKIVAKLNEKKKEQDAKNNNIQQQEQTPPKEQEQIQNIKEADNNQNKDNDKNQNGENKFKTLFA